MKELFLLCALAIPSISARNVPLTDTDKTFFRFLEAMVPSYQAVPGEVKYNIVITPDPVYHWDVLTRHAYEVVPGGFLVVEIRKLSLVRWLMDHQWEILPMYWKKKAIYRRFSA
jgi:hypothetical protein